MFRISWIFIVGYAALTAMAYTGSRAMVTYVGVDMHTQSHPRGSTGTAITALPGSCGHCSAGEGAHRHE
jgi:hypothetical protein